MKLLNGDGRLQVGLAEMQTAVEQTGGLLVQASTFHAQAFKESFRRIFAPASEEGHLGMNSNAHFEVRLPLALHTRTTLAVDVAVHIAVKPKAALTDCVLVSTELG